VGGSHFVAGATTLSSQDIQEFLGLIIESGKHLIQRFVSEMAIDSFTQHATEVSSHSEVATFI